MKTISRPSGTVPAPPADIPRPGQISGLGIQICRLTKHYGTVVALDDVSFDVAPGRVTGFLGPNGSGKTTTMRILLGLSTPTSGRAGFGPHRYADLVQPIHQVGAMISTDPFHPARTARQHLLVMATAAGVDHRRVGAVLGQVGLSDVAGRRVRGYSLGMRQRLGLASALLGDPEVLVLDEPLNGLDPDGITWVRGLLRRLAAEGRTVLLSSHLLAEIARTVDDVVLLDHGHVTATGPLAELMAGHHTDDIEQLFSDLTTNVRYPR